MQTLKTGKVTITGSFFVGPVKLMSEFQKLVHEIFREFQQNNISDDDQHLYLRCYLKNPEFFVLIQGNGSWPEALSVLQINP